MLNLYIGYCQKLYTQHCHFLYIVNLLITHGPKSEADFEKERRDLYAKIGELEMQQDWLKKKSKQLGLE